LPENKTVAVVKRTLLFVCLVAISNVALLAQAPHVKSASQREPARLQLIFGNLGTSQTNLYSTQGWADVAGDGCISPGIFPAMPFVPKSNSHASQVRVPVQWAAGTDEINLSIYDDAGGVPGKLLAGPVTVTNLPNWLTCCALASASFSPVALTGGSQYWKVADSHMDFCGTWAYVARPGFVIAYGGAGIAWQAQDNGIVALAGAVLGTIP
jgi:hypothetical protein